MNIIITNILERQFRIITRGSPSTYGINRNVEYLHLAVLMAEESNFAPLEHFKLKDTRKEIFFQVSAKFFFFFFCLLSFQGRTHSIWRFPDQGFNRSCSCRPRPEPQLSILNDGQNHQSFRFRTHILELKENLDIV